MSVTFSLKSCQYGCAERGFTNTYFCACTASYINSARLRFLPLSFAILIFNSLANGQPSFLPLFASTSQISASVGAATLTSKVLLLIGAIIFAVLFATKINRRFGLYFSIVLLSAAWASRVKWSASLITTTLNLCLALWSTCCVCATSFSRSCTTTRSYVPTSEGVISKW